MNILSYEPGGSGFDSCQPHHYISNKINGLAPQALARFLLLRDYFLRYLFTILSNVVVSLVCCTKLAISISRATVDVA